MSYIVEGHGEVEAVPILVRRIGQAMDPPIWVDSGHPIRSPRSSLLHRRELERAVLLAALNCGPSGGILILIDSEEDCPAHLGPELARRAQAAHAGVEIAVVLAKREFECWFLAAADSLRGRRGLPEDLSAHPNPESVQNAKGWLTKQMGPGRKYSEILDQPAMTS